MRQLLDAAGVTAAVDSLAAQIAADIQRSGRIERWALVGIRAGGVPLADALSERLARRIGRRPLRGDVDITLYRDDLYTGLEKPVLGDTDIPFEVSGCGIVLVDDVLFTGRTVRAAMGEVWDFGRPACIRLAVLVDRGHRELPIAPDFTGLTIATELGDKVVVDWEPAQVVIR